MSKKIITDLHTHSESSHDSTCSVYEMCRGEIEQGIKICAITDHCDILYCNKLDLFSPIKKSFNDTMNCSELFRGKLDILFGIEIGEGFWYPDVTDKIINMYDYDLIIGSVHTVKYRQYTEPYSCIDFSEWSIDEIYRYLDKYYDDVMVMLESTPCNVIAHLTCPLRYINGKFKKNINNERFSDKITEILKMIIRKRIALEINTSGIVNNSGTDRLLPDEKIIRKYKELGGEYITIGSDAHIRENAAKGFEKVYSLLKTTGFDGYYYFNSKKPKKIYIGE